MTVKEEIRIAEQVNELLRQGRWDESAVLCKTVPLYPPIAKSIKKLDGLDALLNGGWDLSEVVEAYGPEFLTL
jgi:hypothetical protein